MADSPWPVRGPNGRFTAGTHGSPRSTMEFTADNTVVHRTPDWKSWCPDCQGPNPGYQRQAVADSCEGSLGSIKTAYALETCPHCHASNTAKIALSEYYACADCDRPIAATAEEAEGVESCPGCHGHSLKRSSD